MNTAAPATSVDSTEFEATYSPEDNKLRLYPSARLPEPLYARVKEAGFKWAPKQELFVAPRWSPAREDLCVELAGGIDREETTLAERAEVRAARMDGYAASAAQRADAFRDAARRIGERFASGQPILVGHHSERRARRDQEKMHAASTRSSTAAEASRYWQDRAAGVERHVGRKDSARVRLGRIATLLKELRDAQRRIHHATLAANAWREVRSIEDDTACTVAVTSLAGRTLPTGPTCRSGGYFDLVDGKEEGRPFAERVLAAWESAEGSESVARTIEHVLHRLAYERAELGAVPRFSGKLTAPLLQTFARTHGAHKPIASLGEDGRWRLASDVALPAHLGDGREVELTEEEWRALMQGVGFEVPISRRKSATTGKAPLVNPTDEDAARLQAIWNARDAASRARREGRAGEPAPLVRITQRGYTARSGGSCSPCRTIECDAAGREIRSVYGRPKAAAVLRLRVASSGSIVGPLSVIVLTDKPQRAVPLDLDELEATATTDSTAAPA